MRYFYLYKITDLETGKVYVGVHETEDLNDGYMGSGKVIRRMINKYGVNRFQKDILEFFESREAMYSKEKEIVTEEFCKETNNYNITPGGLGGSILLNRKPFFGPHTPDSKKKIGTSAKGRTISTNTRKKLSENNFARRNPERQREHAVYAGKRRWALADDSKARVMSDKTKEKLRSANLGKTHSIESKEKMSNKRKSRPPQRWIHNNVEKKTKMIGKFDPLPNGWVEGRKLKFI